MDDFFGHAHLDRHPWPIAMDKGAIQGFFKGETGFLNDFLGGEHFGSVRVQLATSFETFGLLMFVLNGFFGHFVDV